MRRMELVANSHMGNKLTYTWFIKDFPCASSNELNIWESPVFEHGFYKQSWLLRCAANRSSLFSVYLKLVSSKSYEVKAKWKFSVLHPVTEEWMMKAEKEFVFTQGKLCGFQEFACTTWLRDEVTFGNSLMGECELIILVENEPFQVAESKIDEHFGNLFYSKAFSDVTLAVGGQEIKAHKAILSSRSVVFEAMFKHEMKESNLNIVDVIDVNYEVFKEMLHFMYTGKSPNLYKIADELLAAADKYALDRLKSMCEKQLCADLSIEKAAQILTLADRYSAVQLKFRTIDYIKKHATNVEATHGWKNLIETHPKLIAEVFHKFVS